MMLKALLLLSVAVASYAFVCFPDFCSKMQCEDMTSCSETNGMRIREKGSFCRCCDICVRVLGEGQRCQPKGELLGFIIYSECDKGLVCDRALRSCIRPTVEQ